jgi:dTDP-glucose pyrophosphorylase/CBS domain-containing protein
MPPDPRDYLVSPEWSIRDVLACIDRNGEGIALVVTADARLLTTITDGDVRRAILDGVEPLAPVSVLQQRRLSGPHPLPLTASSDTSPAELLRLMTQEGLRHVPLLDADGRVVGIGLLSELLKEHELPIRAVIMAGGLGKRMMPLTRDVPKPMLLLGGKPLLERIVAQLRDAGIRQVNVTTHYRGDVIQDHFGDGSEFGVEIQYVGEDRPLGTAGALAKLPRSREPLLVINGDIVTGLDFRAMLEFHHREHADMSVAVREQEWQIPYGVVDVQPDGQLRSIVEKPVQRYFINAGIYLLNPSVLQTIEADVACDMPELIARVVAEKRRVVCFPIREYWQDIGQLQDYEKVKSDVQTGVL